MLSLMVKVDNTLLVSLLILMFISHSSQELIPHKFFYIYDWPEKFNNVYPPSNATLDSETFYHHDFGDNDGIGKLLNRELGVFATWQFSLYRNIMARLRVSEYRTLNSSEASAFIVPYDMGINSYIDHTNGRVRLASPFGWKVIRQLEKEKKRHPHVWKNNGHDHFLLFSLVSGRMVGMGTRTFFEKNCKNCSALTVETTPFKISMRGVYIKTKKFWHAVPYPSSFHWCEGISAYPWSFRDDGSKRNILAIFIGSVEMTTPISTKLRRQLYADCAKHPDCQWHMTEHSCRGIQNLNNTSNAPSPVLLYKQSVFCLSPTGDSFTRKSLFDSYLAGCIPVIFSKLTLNMYEWHLPQDDIDATSVFIPRTQVIKKKVNFMNELMKISAESIVAMQRAIELLAFRLQYSVVPEAYRQEVRDDTGLYLRKTWRPPQKDAVDVIIERILDRNTIEPINGYPRQTYLNLQNGQDDFLRSEWMQAKADRPLINKKFNEILLESGNMKKNS